MFNEHFTFHPPRARLYIVEPGPKIVPADAGAEKNSRKEVKRVKKSIFLYFFIVFLKFSENFEKNRQRTISGPLGERFVSSK